MASDAHHKRPLTWSSSVTFTLTHDCPWHCAYCGFRTDREGLISEEEVDRLIAVAMAQGAKEALLISGEHPGTMPHIRKELAARGFGDFWDFAIHVARRVLEAGLLPHGNYGAIPEPVLRRLRPVHVSMGVMLENVEDLPEVAPEKKAAGRLATLAAAGRCRIPFTSGILIGLGEGPDSRVRSLEALAALHRKYGHLQEILIQNYVPNNGSAARLAKVPLGLDEYIRLIEVWRGLCPDVPVQIPPNLNPCWRELIPWADDFGGISTERDEVNPQSPWRAAEAYRHAAEAAGRELRERLAVYPRFIDPVWLDGEMLRAVRES
ncbi:MAG: 7,8-didemethyl-8-hydroxy-5-deazariboflavin synthase subunit CofG [Candidatus Methylacidiphilales bacterium]|nr:7,8-didemethyl-8-hydroxy-5-deazariboflavin synthase subunit CofG [Candidatus Methylacidiphilales bacterium]